MELQDVLHKVVDGPEKVSTYVQDLIRILDLTLLDEKASNEALLQLKKAAQENHVAAICVYIKALDLFRYMHGIQLATVVNFPDGNEALNSSLLSIEQAKKRGATEIDYVLPYQLYLAGQTQEALNRCKAVIESCKTQDLTVKIILESGAFTEQEVLYEVSKSLIELGVDFLKTSTGKIAQGASLSAVFTMLNAIKDSESTCGIKISGGVKTPQQAFNYAKLAEFILGKKIDKSWFRIGASSLLNELLK